MGCLLSSEITYVAGVEAFGHVEGNMCGLVMREAVVPPESLEHITCKRRPSEAGRSPDWPDGDKPIGPHREGEEP